MTNTVLIKRSGTANSVPLAANLQSGELAINYTDGNLFFKNSSNVVTTIASTQFVSVTGNVTGGNLNAVGLSLSGNVVSTINSASNITTTANISGGNITTSGLLTATNQMVIVAPSPTSEGGQIVLAWANISGITGQANSTWNLDVDSSNNFRVFSQNATGVANVVLSLNSATQVASFGGNVSGSYFIGNGSALTGITASAGAAITNGTSNVTVVANSNVTVGITGTTVATFASTGEYVTGLISATGNITGGNLNAAGLSLSSNVVSALVSAANITTTANISGGFILGNGSQLTGISVSTTRIFNGTSEANIGTSGGNANITIGGTSNVAVFTTAGLNITGVMSASGNVIAGNLNAAGLSLSSNVVSALNSTSNITTTANITGGNIVTSGASGNITGANVISATTLSATANIIGGNLNAAGLSLSSNVVSALVSAANITTTANIAANYFIGNGSQLTGIASGSSTKISNGTSEANIGTASGNANITIGGVSNVAVFTTTGLNVTGNISATGNISSGLFYGGGNMGLDTEAVTQTFNFGNLTAAVDTIYQLNVVTAPGDAVNGVNIIDNTITGAKLVTGITLPAPNIGVATGTSLSVTGNVTAGGLVAPAASVSGTVYADRITTVSIPQVLNDISYQCDGAKMVFPLQVDQSNITSANITDSKNLQVAVSGRVLSPWVNTQTWPWFQTFAGFPTLSPGYRVTADATSANITFYQSPAQGSQVVLTIINNSSTAQLRKYPYSATTVALGD